jgi:prepilin-type N-terminal cleavage/methylation domain-containing protein
MKKLRETRGLTLVEVIVSIAIFAAIALPLFSVFVQSIKTDKASVDVLNANYIAQDYIEKLDGATYKQALEERPSGTAVGNYRLSAVIKPYGTSPFGSACGFAHINLSSDGTMLAVMPDGKWSFFASLPSTISLSLSGSNYTFKGGSITLTGNVGYGYCAVVINATKKPVDTKTTITLGTNCKAAYYCKELIKNDITIDGTGSQETYTNNIIGDKSLVYVKASVYDSSSKEVAFSESYIHIKNW